MQEHWNKMYQSDNGAWERPDIWLVKALEAQPVGTALEFGAGSGTNALWMAANGWQVTALDYAPAGVDLIRKRAEAAMLSLTAEVADITRYNASTEFDLVYMCYIHLPAAEARKAFANAVASLKPGGRLLYIGMTDVTDLPASADPAWFARAETVCSMLPDSMTVTRSQTAARTVQYSSDMTVDVTGVLVDARKS